MTATPKEIVVSLPDIVNRDEWIAARKDLLVQEKELTRRRDALNATRRRLPMVEITEDYRFDSPDGRVSLLDLFDGRRQLVVGHFMFSPDWDEGCASCSAGADETSAGLLEHLAGRDTSYACVSRAPIDRIERYREQKGWLFRWVSSFDSDFNYDFHVTLDDTRAPVEYNYRTLAEHAATGATFYTEGDGPMELPGLSCFLRDGDRIFHTYSMYARGAEQTGGSYYFLDLTALGRQEDWEEPKGRGARPAVPEFSS